MNPAGHPAHCLFGHILAEFGFRGEQALQASGVLGQNNSMSSLTCRGMSGHVTVARQFEFYD